MTAALGATHVWAADDAVEEIVVSGIKESLAKALDVKKEKVQIVDSVVAEDIGKFPDNNVVESLQRVTGVQVTNRGSGEVSGISIRGLTDVTTTVNGRNIFTASGQSVALQDVPASLLRQVDVYKTRSASQIESGIAGVVDIKTQRPFDFDGSKFVVAARGIYQEQADKTDPNISALASNRWDTAAGEFGALVNLSYATTNYRDQSVTAGAMVPFATNNPVGPFTNYERIFLTHANAQGVLDVAENPIWTPGLLNGLSSAPGSTLSVNGKQMEYILSRDAIFQSDFTGERKRPAANISLQFAPDDKSEYTFESFYNGYRNSSFNSLLFSFVDWWGDYKLANPPAANVVLYPGTNIVKSRSDSHPYMFTSGDMTTAKTDSYVESLGGKWKLSDNLTLKSELVYQKSTYESSFVAMRFEKAAYAVDVDFNSGGGLPAWSFVDDPLTTGIDESDRTSGFRSANFYDNGNKNQGDAITFTSDATYTLDDNFFTTVDVGVRYDKRTASEAAKDQNGWNNSIVADNIPGLNYVNNGFFDGESDVPTTWAVANGEYLRSHIGEIRTIYGMKDTGQALIKNFDIDEATTSAYVVGKYATELGGRKLDGEIGLRYTGSSTDMAFVDRGTHAVSSADASTSKVLPSLMIRYSLQDDLFARFAYTETLRRPNFSQLNANINYYEDVTNIGYGTANGGNPDLKPTESKNYDLSLEWYFGDSSSLYGTLFKRDITGFVIDFRRQVQHAKSTTNSTPYTFVLAQPYNASNGELHGAEVGLVWFPENLPSALDGFGIQASYTMLDSSQTTPVTNSKGEITEVKKTDLFGVSDSSYSVVLAYDKNKWGARLSYAWRSAFLNNYEAALFANPIEVWRKPEASMDLQVSYKALDNLELTLDGTNLTGEIYQSYYGANGATTNNFGSAIYSRTFAIGARYSF